MCTVCTCVWYDQKKSKLKHFETLVRCISYTCMHILNLTSAKSNRLNFFKALVMVINNILYANPIRFIVMYWIVSLAFARVFSCFVGKKYELVPGEKPWDVIVRIKSKCTICKCIRLKVSVEQTPKWIGFGLKRKVRSI